jgi:hypothetical protein
MAFKREVLIIDAGDETIKVGHTFYGVTQQEVDTYFREHMTSCEYFSAAVKEGRTLDETEEIDDDELPEVDEDDDEETDG